MNYVIAKLKKEDEYRKVYGGESIYNMPENTEYAIEYVPTRNLDDDEWFVLKEFSQKDYCIDLLKKDFRTTDYFAIDNTNAETMEYICSYDEGKYFFQRIFKHNIMAHKYLTLGDNVKLKKEKSIVINETPDAIYLKEEDKLLFRKLQTIVPIFKGIEELYKEATKEETEEFLDNDFIALTNNYNADKVKTTNRKRIALAMETLKGFDKKQRKQVLEYTHKYYPQLEFKNNTFSIGTEEDMKYLLWGIEQRYYTTPVTNEKRVANSVMSLEGVVHN